MSIYKVQKEKHISLLTSEIENKETVLKQVLEQQLELTKKNELLQKEIDCAKEEIASLKIQIQCS